MPKLKLLFVLMISIPGMLQAQVKTITGPVGSGDFGYSVTALANGNYVITDPYFIDGLVQNAGAVYLYNGKTHSLISTLKGKYNNDFFGRDGIIALTNGNFVVLSYAADNGALVDCGAVTWVDGVSGLSGVITPSNSLFGTATNDSLGSGGPYSQGVVVFDNGNYALVSPGWDNGSIIDAGAVTLLNGAGPMPGAISAGNSLIGGSTDDKVGADGIFVLDNNNFLVRSFNWDNGAVVNAGAVTWCNGLSPTTGVISSANSLVGSSTDDFVGTQSVGFYENTVIKLTNGNFVIINPGWDNAGIVDAGAVTWGSNSLGVKGVIGSTNSLVGTTDYEQVGGGQESDIRGVVALANGNYVVATPGWDKADSIHNAGAVTWGNGMSGIAGTIDITNSLVGSSVEDEVGRAASGWCGVIALTNGNYVVGTAYWDNGPNEAVGAVTWGNGVTGTTGEVSPANSLVGTTSFDFTPTAYAFKLVTPLSNGNYVVSAPNWDNGLIVDVGSATWANGNSGIAGEIDSSRSLIGSATNERLGYVTPLSNGNYVVTSAYWDNGSIIDAGAVTWGNGDAGRTGFIDSTNSLVGSHDNDNLGASGVAVLNNGNYVVSSPSWDNGALNDAGAATWGNGNTGITGTVSSSNSLVGSTAGDRVSRSIAPLSNGNYVVGSAWSDGSYHVGAQTWGNGNSGITGSVNSTNSLVGSHNLDYVSGVFPFHNGNYLVLTQGNQVNIGTGKGAVTWANGLTGIAGVISSSNSLVGTSPLDFIGEHFMISDDHYVVISPHYNNGTITDAGAATLGSTVSGVAGEITNCNSILGESANEGWRLILAQSDVYGYLLAGQAKHNSVLLLQPVSATLSSTSDSASVSINGNAPVNLLTSDGCHLIASITAHGAAPVQGSLKAKMWREANVLVHDGHPYVARHYEITPTLNASTATARITLYFTQQEFDDFNSHSGSTTDLPASAADTAGIAKLRIIKFPGISNDNSGLPGSYTGTPVVIDPVDQDIAWNNTLSRWEVSFDVTGFSGFIVQTVNVVTGVNDITNNSYLLHLFPNPVRENLSYELKSNAAGNYTIKIFDLNGRLMYSESGRGSGIGNSIRGTINTDVLSRGTYIVEITTRKTTARKKLVKM